MNPGAHRSQNWPAKPGGQEQDSTHGAGGLAGPRELKAEVRVTSASCDVSGEKEEKRCEESFVIKLMLTKVRSKMIIVASEACCLGDLLFSGIRCVCMCVCLWVSVSR